MTNEEQFQTNLGNQLNRRWGAILGQSLIIIEQLEFQISQQVVLIQEMTKNEKALTERINDLEKEVLAAQGKAIIDNTR